MATFAVDRLFQDGLAIGIEGNDLEVDSAGSIASYSAEVRREISARMAEALESVTDSEKIEFEDAGGAVAHPSELASALFRLRSGGVTEKIIFLRVKDSVVEATIPLVSLAVAAFSGDVKGIVSGAQALIGLWKNLLTLKRDTDSSAIDVYEALVATGAASRLAGRGPPTTEEIAARVPVLELSKVASVLGRLVELKLIEVAKWGADHGDIIHVRNAWSVRL